VHSNDKHLLVIGTIEDADPAAFGKPTRAAPEKIVLQFLRTWLLETVNLATFWVYAGHDVADGAILSGAVHSLKDQQQRVVVGCVVQLL
jgi:hypothetical protein